MTDITTSAVTKIEGLPLCNNTVFNCFSDYGPYLFVAVFIGIIIYCIYLYIKDVSPQKNKLTITPRINIIDLPNIISNLSLRQKIVMLYLLFGAILVGYIFNYVLDTGKLDYFVFAILCWFFLLIPVYHFSPDRISDSQGSRLLNYLLFIFILAMIVDAFLYTFLGITLVGSLTRLVF